MPTVADVVRRYGAAYLQKFGSAVPVEHRQVLRMIARCRTGELGTVVYRCEQCQTTHCLGRSCGNRHCPTCQQHKTKAWREAQTSRLLPCPCFLLTFTLPASLRRFVRAHQRACYAALFRASSETIRTLAADPKYVGSRNSGFFGVLLSGDLLRHELTLMLRLDSSPSVRKLAPSRAGSRCASPAKSRSESTRFCGVPRSLSAMATAAASARWRASRITTPRAAPPTAG